MRLQRRTLFGHIQRKVEQYVGDYFDVLEEIAVKIEKEKKKKTRKWTSKYRRRRTKANFSPIKRAYAHSYQTYARKCGGSGGK